MRCRSAAASRVHRKLRGDGAQHDSVAVLEESPGRAVVGGDREAQPVLVGDAADVGADQRPVGQARTPETALSWADPRHCYATPEPLASYSFPAGHPFP